MYSCILGIKKVQLNVLVTAPGWVMQNGRCVGCFDDIMKSITSKVKLDANWTLHICPSFRTSCQVVLMIALSTDPSTHHLDW